MHCSQRLTISKAAQVQTEPISETADEINQSSSCQLLQRVRHGTGCLSWSDSFSPCMGCYTCSLLLLKHSACWVGKFIQIIIFCPIFCTWGLQQQWKCIKKFLFPFNSTVNKVLQVQEVLFFLSVFCPSHHRVLPATDMHFLSCMWGIFLRVSFLFPSC